MQRIHEQLSRAAERVKQAVSERPQVALVLGSGLGSFADMLAEKVSIPYTEIPGMLPSSVAGHAGKLVFGTAGGKRVAAMQGRVHLYEGHTPEQVVFGVRLMRALGASTLVLTNAAGGIRRDFQPGDLMVIEDHLNLTGHNCLRGPNETELGPRFPDMSEGYDRELRALLEQVARTLGIGLRRGVYAGVLGPSYETPAEIRMLAALGADAVGMSTVLEAIAARHMGARTVGISCITNLAAGLGARELTHEDVQETARAAEATFARLLLAFLTELAA